MKRGGWCAFIVVCGLAAGARADDVGPAGTTREAPAEEQPEPQAERRAELPAGGLDSTDPALVEFARHFSGHEPIYFLAGTKAPNVKFQVSFKYAVANPEAPLVKKFPALEGINLAYTQTSLWDTSDESAPFFDSSYKPEVLWSDEYIPALSRQGSYGLGLQFGVQHESNGKGGLDSRSLNIAYVRPVFTLGDPRDFRLTVAPRVFTYLGGQGDNEDIENYRGYADLRAKVGWRDGLELSALGRLGDDWEHGSIQLDLTYPLRKLFFGNLDVYLDVQGFYGYGESLLGYNQRTSAVRFGIAVVR